MAFTRKIPYVITSTLLICNGIQNASSDNIKTSFSSEKKQTITIKPYLQETCLDDKTFELADAELKSNTAVHATEQKYDVVYTHANGNQLLRSGGTRAWRNNNPGCLRYSKFAIAQGAIGQAGGFAVFPDENTGMRAICALLKSDKYINLTIFQAIFMYAPPHENDTEMYNAYMYKLTGMPTSTKLSDLTDEQIMKVASAIRIVEGWKPGNEKLIKSVQKDSLKTYQDLQSILLNKCIYERTI